MAKKLSIASLAVATIGAAALSVPATAIAASNRPPSTPPGKTSICHYDKTTGTWALLSVSSQSVAQHMKHGDGIPGGAVPGQAGKVFSASCAPVDPV